MHFFLLCTLMMLKYKHVLPTVHKTAAILLQDGSLPFARSISDTQSEFRLLSKLTELLMKHGDQEEALQYATLAVQIAGKTGTCRHGASGPTPQDGSLSSEETNESCRCCSGVTTNERTAYHRLATVYYNLQQYEMAENYYLKCLAFCPAVLQQPAEARYYTKLYSRLGNFTLHKLKVGEQTPAGATTRSDTARHTRQRGIRVKKKVFLNND